MNFYLVIVLCILAGTFLLDVVVDLLNVRYAGTELPEEFKDFYDKEKYRKSQEYLRENTKFGIISDAISTSLTIVFIVLGGFNMVDRFARGFHLGTIPTGLIFTAVLMLASQIIHIPLSAYDTFVIEEKYGFNKTTLKTFVMDILKSWLLAVVIGGGILSAVLWIFETVGMWAWFYCWMAITVFQIFLMFVAPAVILPIFNKFEPLEDGSLKDKIENYVRSQAFRMKGVFKVDGSRRSTKTNAFFTGFGRFRRIALFDTLIARHTEDEIVSILAHEMGHYKKKHILKFMVLSIFTTGLMCYILSLFIGNKGLFAAFQMEEISIYASLFFFGFLYTPIEMIIGILENALSRRHEYEADAFAVKTYGKPEAMILALKKLSLENLSNLTPHPFKVFLSYSHPPVLERIRAIRNMVE
ncbi:MAG: M48 family peptidase [Deltaproteobacteria bacterium]|nr:MAG: M48 family peptidase [Deltaproteobacteria bacterium]